MTEDIKIFILHLRLHYQFLILSGAFLSGGILVEPPLNNLFWLEFFSVHIFLYGGATAYNSYYDKDEGPIGGLEKPPKMKEWMLNASILTQLFGLVVGALVGLKFLILYSVCMVFSYLYSNPSVRWKGNMFLSVSAIGVSTILPFYLGYLSAGAKEITIESATLSLGVAFSILSFYPISQLYQVSEDLKRGDITLAVKYGLKGAKIIFLIFYILGAALIIWVLRSIDLSLTLFYVFGNFIIGIFIWYKLKTIKLVPESYHGVMRLKYLTGSLFLIFILFTIFLKTFAII